MDNQVDFNSLWAFVQVARSGSFTAAATSMRIPKSTLSKRVSELEQQLGTSLLTRTTRKLSLTSAGRAIFERCARGFEEILAAEEQASASTQDRKNLQGTIRVTATADMASTFLAELLAEFMRDHPGVRIDLLSTDRMVDLIGENIDLALRAGKLEDSSLIARKVGLTRFKLFASPAYLKKRGTPRAPGDLASHECLRFSPIETNARWTLRQGSKSASVACDGRFVTNELRTLKILAIQGHGVALLPSFICQGEVESGKLQEVLGEWGMHEDPVHIVQPRKRFIPARTEALVRFIAPRIQAALARQ